MTLTTTLTTKEFTILMNGMSSYKKDLHEIAQRAPPEVANLCRTEYAEAHALFLAFCTADQVTLTMKDTK